MNQSAQMPPVFDLSLDRQIVEQLQHVTTATLDLRESDLCIGQAVGGELNESIRMHGVSVPLGQRQLQKCGGSQGGRERHALLAPQSLGQPRGHMRPRSMSERRDDAAKQHVRQRLDGER